MMMNDPVEDALAAAAEAAEAAFMPQHNNSKWSRNGFGSAVSKQQGKFSKEESELVRKAVEDYCAAKQITPARLCSECDHKVKSELKGSWMEIAKRLPHRSVQSVYRHGIRQLHPFKRGAWSEQEVALLNELVQRMGKKWSVIQNKLNRSAECCRDKYREMSDDYVKGRWKDSELEMLRRLVREHLNADPSADMKMLGKMVQEQGIQLPWSTISKRMGKRSRLSCFKKWQKMAGLLDDSRRRKREAGLDLEQPLAQRQKLETAAAMEGYEEMYNSAKMAEETVEAVELPDVDVGNVPNVREI